MPAMTNPMDALKTLPNAIANGEVRLKDGKIHADIKLILDLVGGRPRFTYVKLVGDRPAAILIVAHAQPFKGLVCFDIGYAVFPKYRRKGFGIEIVQKGLEELKFGLRNVGVEAHFYIEAVVGTANDASNKIARRLLSSDPIPGIDSHSKEPILQYLKLIED